MSEHDEPADFGVGDEGERNSEYVVETVDPDKAGSSVNQVTVCIAYSNLLLPL